MEWFKVGVLGYLLGSIPFGYLVGRFYKVDVRNYGSGNIGFTNVMRVIGVYPAAVVLLFDALKGYIAAWFGFYAGGEVLAVFGALAAMAGHNWPFSLKFKGGRGVATGLGIIVFLSGKVTLGTVIIWIFIVALTRYVSLGSIIAAAFVPLAMVYFEKPIAYIVFSLIGASLVIIRHKTNIKRLIEGKENKIGNKVLASKGEKK